MEGTPEAAPEAVRQAVGGGCQSRWGRLLSVTHANEAGTCCQGDSGWAGRPGPWGGGGVAEGEMSVPLLMIASYFFHLLPSAAGDWKPFHGRSRLHTAAWSHVCDGGQTCWRQLASPVAPARGCGGLQVHGKGKITGHETAIVLLTVALAGDAGARSGWMATAGGWGVLQVQRAHTAPVIGVGRGGGGRMRKGGGGGTKIFVYPKWPNQIFPVVNFVFSHDAHFGLGGGGGVTPLPRTAILILAWGWAGVGVAIKLSEGGNTVNVGRERLATDIFRLK